MRWWSPLHAWLAVSTLSVALISISQPGDEFQSKSFCNHLFVFIIAFLFFFCLYLSWVEPHPLWALSFFISWKLALFFRLKSFCCSSYRPFLSPFLKYEIAPLLILQPERLWTASLPWKKGTTLLRFGTRFGKQPQIELSFYLSNRCPNEWEKR